jgi:hypothetical protein
MVTAIRRIDSTALEGSVALGKQVRAMVLINTYNIL